ncbi:glycoside hydrolase family 97 protein [Sinomicrobium weinanense]|uniref:Glycoside hydrolase family 97 catalytic domain-containing protein n=1 Tax=Sinomicrobium weinanense TaxID=2842200 RepID=A0A926Q5C1_9FLAO|nr:glycoside hydrolase family 97 protein [Sinomicrobium weinanense]MBC9797996.1 glycoside hydrolase family 97 catalytic domain-containing protein [Sinomicrobium weinanense]MBU3125587.1 glycoside hydrolase family 97 protein [Sinomicrobium weinanense]
MNKKRIFVTVFFLYPVLMLAVCNLLYGTEITVPPDPFPLKIPVFSPDGTIEFHVLSDQGRLSYWISMRNDPVVEKSPLGITLNGTDLGNGVLLGKALTEQVNRTYPWRGKHAVATDLYTAVRVPITHNASGTEYFLEVRVYNDGVAFRYVVPGEGIRKVSGEGTGIKIPAGSTVWYHGIVGMHYEEKHKEKDILQIEAGEWAGPPMTVKLPGKSGYMAVTESGVIKSSGDNFPGMALEADGKRGFQVRLGHEHPENYPYVLRYGKEDHKRLTAPPTFTGSIEGPWRVILIGRDLNTLFNADIVHNVAPKPDPGLFPKGFDEEWLAPGRAVWGYLTDEPRTLEGMKNLSGLAGELGFEYHTVEGHWRRWSLQEEKDFVAYSNNLGVKVIYWEHSKNLRDPKARSDFFKHLHEVGVSGAKIDFLDHEAKEVIDLYAACLKEAAQYKLILNFHGANKPAGEARTWPNEMTREGVFGMEFRGPWATHNTTIPFTRLLAGHVDYTPVVFGERRAETSEAHQLASAAILQAPMLNFAEHPQNLLAHKAVEYIRQIPTTWDETIVLPGSEIGKLAAFARRKGDRWFIAVMNGEKGNTIKMDLSFLKNEKDYDMMMIRDKKPEEARVVLVRNRQLFGGGKGVAIDRAKVNRRESLWIDLIPGGGFVAVISE